MNSSNGEIIEAAMRDLEGTGQFLTEPMSRVHLERLLTAFSMAPSASNAQPWEVVVVESEGTKRELAGCLLDTQFRPRSSPRSGELQEGAQWFLAAPLVLVIAIDTMRADAKFGRLGSQRFAFVDLGAAVQNLLLAGRSEGIRGTIVRNLDSSAVCRVLAMPVHVLPVMLVTIGYCHVSSPARPRLTLQDIAHQERWGRRIFEESMEEKNISSGEK